MTLIIEKVCHSKKYEPLILEEQQGLVMVNDRNILKTSTRKNVN